MISYPHFLFASAVALLTGGLCLFTGIRFCLAYLKEKSESIPLFMGLCIFGVGWVLISFFARAFLPWEHALTCTIIGLIGLWFMFPLGALIPLNFLTPKHWKALGTTPFLISFASLGFLVIEIHLKGELIKERLVMGLPFHGLPSFMILQVLLVAIILLVSSLFLYFARVSSGFLRKKALLLGIGSLLLLFLIPDLVGYGMDLLGIWRVGELAGCATLYYGFSLKPR